MLLAAFLIGIVAGSRAMLALAIASWAAFYGTVPAAGWTGFMGWRWTPWVLSVLALGELITDKLPSTPSRKVPVAFGARIVSGLVSGATVAGENWIAGAVLGVVGAIAGTYGLAWARGRLAARLGRDRPAALIEDALAILLGLAATGLV